MFHIVLYEPEIPANTGNIIRLCANTGMRLHLIKPLGFMLEDKKLRRAGLDYHEWVNVKVHDSLAAFIKQVAPARVFAFSTKGERLFTEVTYKPGDALLLGPETRGLPAQIRADLGNEQCLYLPMRPESRSLNLSNVAAVTVFEAWRQMGFAGAVIK
jgi:tRNA (cytidine/uridine-2'-O-)-methyltransferase